MIRTQIQLPDPLYRQARQVARGREISLAELVRRGLEYMISVAPESDAGKGQWNPPAPRHLGGKDPFSDPDWRSNMHLEAGVGLAEPKAEYGKKKLKK